MTADIQLVPSLHDRLDPVGQVLRWWTSQMSDLLGRPATKVLPAADIAQEARRLPYSVTISLGEEDAYAAEVPLPQGHPDMHRSALALRLAEIAPIDPDQLQIFATALAPTDASAVTYAIAMARKHRLDELERAARKKGAQLVAFCVESLPILPLSSPREDRGKRINLIIDAALVLAIAVAAAVAVVAWGDRIKTDTAGITREERTIRSAAVAADAARRSAEQAKQLVDHGVLDRRAGAALRALAELNAATPDGSWWTAVRWTPEETTLTGESADAAAAIDAIAKAAPKFSVELAGPLRAGAPGQAQTFELKASPRKASP